MYWVGVLFGLSLLLYGVYLVTTFRKPLRILLVVSTIVLAASWAGYVYAFVIQDFSLLEVAKNTYAGMEWWLRLAASWSGTGSSLLLFSLFIGLFIAAAYFSGANVNALRISTILLLLVGASTYLYGTFDTLSVPTVGAGLNPLLKSFWIAIHPPLVFLGYAGVLVISLGLIYDEAQKLKRLFYAALAFLFAGLVVGGYWSYVTFGWGGYWAWDPVETAQLMVFVAAVAAIHAPAALAQLRRSAYLLAVSGVFLALFVTRTGMSPLHGFASPGAGGYLLLALSLAFFFGFLRDLLIAKWAPVPWRSVVTFVTIFVAGLLLYGSLLIPSLGVAAGVNTSPPQMDDGMWFYNPALYILVVLTLILAPLIYLDKLGKTFWLYLGAGAVATAAVVGLVWAGVLTFSPKSHILTNMAIGAALVWSALGGAVMLYSAAISKNRTVVVTRLLHFALLLFFVAAVYSLPFAYNRAYFVDAYVAPGGTLNIQGMKISVVNYTLGLMGDKVDIYTVYGNNEVYQYAQFGMLSLTNLLNQARPMLEDAAKRVEGDALLRLLFDVAKEPVAVGDIKCRLADGRELVITNATFGSYAAHAGGGGLYMVVYLLGNSPAGLGNQTSVEVGEPCVVSVGGAVVNMTGRLMVQGAGDSIAVVPMSAIISASERRIAIPYVLDNNLTLFYMTLRPGTPLYGLLNLPYYSLLSNVRFGHAFLEKFPGVVPSGAYLKASLYIDGARRDAVVRYEVNGEVSGIHGLVSSVITTPRGLGDVYIAVFTPYVKGSMSYYPEPMIYYISNVLKTKPPEDALRIAALLTSGFYIDQLRRAGQDFAAFFTTAYLEVLNLAYGYDPAKSPAYTEGIHITIKEIPAVNLLWLSAAVAVAILFILVYVKE
ncbi:MAG: cytochrome c biogenesis protein CcsA [Pyrobaculum arsenaticum]|uniref:cytochrome c biogenesis protein CcsA n=1 Tax=Pyrobaculum arsenaticum TaxID=121277 RepID=UPI002276E642|nr:cytochrome c biogenesis protein CcsA [Pyrobaculum arsenaticum]